MADVRTVQQALLDKGHDPNGIDGYWGDDTQKAWDAFRKSIGLPPSDDRDDKATLTALLGAKAAAKPTTAFKLSAASQRQLAEAHPLLRKLFEQVMRDNPQLKFQILDSRRGRKEQNAAYARGNSKAKFGQSAHNWSPAIALDVTPVPLDWNNIPSFAALSKPILAVAKRLSIPIEWGGTWSLGDYPHYELHKWRDFAKQSKLYEG